MDSRQKELDNKIYEIIFKLQEKINKYVEVEPWGYDWYLDDETWEVFDYFSERFCVSLNVGKCVIIEDLNEYNDLYIKDMVDSIRDQVNDSLIESKSFLVEDFKGLLEE